MGQQIMVAQFHVFEFHALWEIGQPITHGGGGGGGVGLCHSWY